MENKSRKRIPETVPSCPVEGWELLMPISDGSSESQWTACSDGTGQPGGIMRDYAYTCFQRRNWTYCAATIFQMMK